MDVTGGGGAWSSSPVSACGGFASRARRGNTDSSWPLAGSRGEGEVLKRRDVEAREPAQRTRPRITGQSKHAPPPWDKENTRFGCHLKARPREHSPEGAPRIRLLIMTLPTQQREPRPRDRRLENALSPAFVRNVAKAGRYGDGRRRSRSRWGLGSLPGLPREAGTWCSSTENPMQSSYF